MDIKPSRKAVDTWFAGLTEGAPIFRGRNTYWDRPGGKAYTIGERYVVTRPGKTAITLSKGATEADKFWLEPPRRVGDVVALSDTSITYRIGREDHTATWTKVEP